MLTSLSNWLSPTTTIEDTAHPVTMPWQPHPITVDINPMPKNEASIEHLTLLHRLRSYKTNVIAYTDGSQLAGNTGAGYYIPKGLLREVCAIIPMGTTSEVFDAELQAIHECLVACHKYIHLNRLQCHSIHLFTDNQSAIIRSSHLTSGPGQELARAIHDTTLRLKRLGVPGTLHWVPGQTDVSGNDEADHLAKMVTTLPPTTPLPTSLSWLCRQVHDQYIMDWTTWYNSAPKPKTYDTPHKHRLDPAYTTLPRKLSTAILGLRTGHSYFLDCLAHPPTTQYPSRSCTCPLHPPQTPKHLLLSCPLYQDQRNDLRQTPKLPRHRRLTTQTILHTKAGTDALSTMISATKVTTAEWAHAKLRRTPTEGNTPVTLTYSWRTLLNEDDEHALTQ
jgi:ribonuclease HI